MVPDDLLPSSPAPPRWGRGSFRARKTNLFDAIHVCWSTRESTMFGAVELEMGAGCVGDARCNQADDGAREKEMMDGVEKTCPSNDACAGRLRTCPPDAGAVVACGARPRQATAQHLPPTWLLSSQPAARITSTYCTSVPTPNTVDSGRPPTRIATSRPTTIYEDRTLRTSRNRTIFVGHARGASRSGESGAESPGSVQAAAKDPRCQASQDAPQVPQ